MEVAAFEAFVKSNDPISKETSKTALAQTAFGCLAKTGEPWDKYTKVDLNKKNPRYAYLYQHIVNELRKPAKLLKKIEDERKRLTGPVEESQEESIDV